MPSPTPLEHQISTTFSYHIGDETAEILERWKHDCELASRQHSAAFKTYKIICDLVITSSVILGTVSGIATICLTALLPTLILPVISGTASIVVAGIVALGKGFSVEAKMHQHNQYSAFYSEVARDILQEATLRPISKSQYSDAGEFLKTISDRIDRLTAGAPSLPC